MNQPKLKTAYILSTLIAVLSAAVSIGGLLFRGLYRDNAFVSTTWLGNDAVTLLLAIPILALAMVFAWRGSLRARLIWMGALDYMLYNYAFYLFGAAFNAFFLVYVALIGLAMFALIFALPNIDAAAIAARFSPRTPVRWIGGYFLFVAAGLTIIYLMMSFNFIVTGQLPDIVERSGHPTSIVFALDLTLLAPWLALGAVWLMQRRPWGYVIAGVLSVKAPLYTLILSINTVLVARAGLADGGELPLWVTLTVLGLLAGVALYANMRRQL
jgi:hypothetical protein